MKCHRLPLKTLSAFLFLAERLFLRLPLARTEFVALGALRAAPGRIRSYCHHFLSWCYQHCSSSFYWSPSALSRALLLFHTYSFCTRYSCAHFCMQATGFDQSPRGQCGSVGRPLDFIELLINVDIKDVTFCSGVCKLVFD